MPASLAQRVGPALRRRVDLVRHRGSVVGCPVRGRFDRFEDAWNRQNALCWPCGSHERHRAQWLLFTRRPELLRVPRSLLHFAPEWTMGERIAPIAAERGIRYITADLDPEGVDLELDLQALALPDDCFDAVMCSHVLEHVPDDAAAMRELRRVTASGGWCLVMVVPLDTGRTETYEDPSVVEPEDRRREFLQHDHVRLYAPDIADRLAAAGFDVEIVRPEDLPPGRSSGRGCCRPTGSSSAARRAPGAARPP